MKKGKVTVSANRSQVTKKEEKEGVELSAGLDSSSVEVLIVQADTLIERFRSERLRLAQRAAAPRLRR